MDNFLLVMHLKSIELHGFKSFAQKAVLEFLPPDSEGRNSITAVVGPNGSGKSNIADAIRWVMGEQSLKALRGKKSADVIFSGSEHKGQMGIAGVSMVLDNSEGRAHIDYDELVIARRLYRSGESEYLVNGHSVRLLDLQLLLAKAQFGQGSYSVIGQGMIDRMILQTPEERKDFFDEAVGIKEFIIKRHQAVLKLHRTKENVGQAEALLNEISPRLRSLSRQVKKLAKRNDVVLQLREAQEQYFGSWHRHNQDELTQVQKHLNQVNHEFEQSSQKLSSIQTELGGLAREESGQILFAQLQQEQQTIIRQKTELERERAILQGKLQTEYTKVGKQNIGWLQNKIENLTSEKARVEKELADTEERLDRANKKAGESKDTLEQSVVRRTELKFEITSVEQSTNKLKGERSYWEYSGLRAVQAVLEERHRLGTVYGTVAQLGEVKEKYCLALDVAAGSHLSSLVVDGDRTAQTCIEYLRDKQLGVATFLPLNKIRPRMVPQDIHDMAKRSGVIGLAVDLINFDTKFRELFSYILGNTLVVEDLDVAREIGIGRVRMVTLNGDVVETSGSMRGGYRNKEKERRLSFSHSDSPYMLQSQTEDQENHLITLKSELADVEARCERLQSELQESQLKVNLETSIASTIDLQKQNINQELANLEQEYSLTTMSPDEFDARMKDIVKQKNRLEKEMEGVEDGLRWTSKKIEEFNQNQETKKQRIFALQESMQIAQNKLNQVVEERNNYQVQIAKLETRLENLENEAFQELHSSLVGIKERGFVLLGKEELTVAGEEIQKLKYQLSLIGGIDEEVVGEYEETKEKHDTLVEQLDDLQSAMADLEKLVIELDEMMKRKRSKGFQQIKKEFNRYFGLLFDGGKADLVELYGDKPDDELDEEQEQTTEDLASVKKKEKMLLGIEITACPPGKKIKSVQSLSGGERTLTSIALVCAILHTNPSPFVVLDEVEAALDESNSQRFARILRELSFQSQFVIITHNRVTMHASDALYGVTMGNDGVSRLVSVKLES